MIESNLSRSSHLPSSALASFARRATVLAVLSIIFAALVLASVPPQVARGTPSSAQQTGYNMDYPGDWTNAPPFIDLMKNARAVLGSCSSADPGCDPAAHLDLDAAGWLRTLRYRDNPGLAYANAVVYINTSGDRPDIGHPFVMTWEGTGDIEVVGGGDVNVDDGRRRATFTLLRGNTFLRLRDIDPRGTGDYLRNIRIFRTVHEERLARGELFNPDLVVWLAPFASLRFMDWMQSNSYGECSGGSRHGLSCYAGTNEDCRGGRCLMPGQWTERPTTDQRSMISWGQYLDTAAPGLGTRVGGYPLEVMVRLANELRKNPHFNMPVHASVDYVTRFAALVRDQLDPSLVASVEYSNEVWNWGFPQADYAHQRGQQLWPGLGTAWVQYAAARTHEMCRIWKRIFFGQEHRVRCLISPQTGWPELARTMLDCPAWVASHPRQTSCTEYVDAINITGYFTGCLAEAEREISTWLTRGRQTALQCGFHQLNAGGLIAGCDDSLNDTIARYAFFRELATPRGLGLVVYEGGTHFSYEGPNAAVRQYLTSLTRDPRMYHAYRRNLQGFWDNGGSTFNAWGWIEPNDPWSLAEHLTDFTHPKYRAMATSGDGKRTPAPKLTSPAECRIE